MPKIIQYTIQVSVITAIAGIFLVSGCSSVSDQSRFFWTSKSDDPLPQPLENFQRFSSATESGQIESKHWVHLRQEVEGAQVEGGSAKVIYDGNGEVVFAHGTLLNSIDKERLRKSIQNLKQRSREFKESLIRNHPGVASSASILKHGARVVSGFLKHHVRYYIHALNPEETDVKEYLFNKSGDLIDTQSVAHRKFEGKGQAFPRGPEKSGVAHVLLKNLSGEGVLKSEKLNVISALERAVSTSHQFFYPLSNAHFDEVQAFYYAQAFMNWVKSRFQTELPYQLEVKLHVRADGPTNAAFYYDGKVRLGEGDGVLYREIPRDPSIVIHEVAHAYIDLLADLPFRGEGGSLNEAYADFLAASFLENPRLSDYAYLKGDYRRTVFNELHLVRDRTGRLYNDSLIVSGTLWAIRGVLGAEKGEELAFQTLARLHANSDFESFHQTLRWWTKENLNETEKRQVFQILDERGWDYEAASSSVF